MRPGTRLPPRRQRLCRPPALHSCQRLPSSSWPLQVPSPSLSPRRLCRPCRSWGHPAAPRRRRTGRRRHQMRSQRLAPLPLPALVQTCRQPPPLPRWPTLRACQGWRMACWETSLPPPGAPAAAAAAWAAWPRRPAAASHLNSRRLRRAAQQPGRPALALRLVAPPCPWYRQQPEARRCPPAPRPLSPRGRPLEPPAGRPLRRCSRAAATPRAPPAAAAAARLAVPAGASPSSLAQQRPSPARAS